MKQLKLCWQMLNFGHLPFSWQLYAITCNILFLNLVKFLIP